MSNSKRGRPGKGASVLSAEVILDCAKTMMAQQGKPPSIRKLAEVLQVDAMAIYHYYTNKAALLEAIAVSLIDEIFEPTGQASWQDEIIELSQSYLKLLARYSGLLETLLCMESQSPAQIFFERFQRILQPLQLSVETEKDALDLLVDYLHGFAFAMSCNSDHPMSLDIKMADGPLRLFCRGLESHL